MRESHVMAKRCPTHISCSLLTAILVAMKALSQAELEQLQDLAHCRPVHEGQGAWTAASKHNEAGLWCTIKCQQLSDTQQQDQGTSRYS